MLSGITVAPYCAKNIPHGPGYPAGFAVYLTLKHYKEHSVFNAKSNPIAVILNIDSTSNLAPLYSKFCGIWQAEAKQMQWLFLQCSEVTQDGQFLRVTVSQDAPSPDVLLRIPMHFVSLVTEARGK